MQLFATKRHILMTPDKTPAKVAAMATETTVIPRGLILLGVFGTSEEPRALIRLTSGRTRTIMPGDFVSGRMVAGIDDTSVHLRRGSTVYRLTMPGHERN